MAVGYATLGRATELLSCYHPSGVRTGDLTAISSSAEAVLGTVLFGKGLPTKGDRTLGLLCLSCSKPSALHHVIWAGETLPVRIGTGRAPYLGQPGNTGGHNSCIPQHVPR